MTNEQLMQIGYRVTAVSFKCADRGTLGNPYYVASYNGAEIGMKQTADWAWDLCHDAHKAAQRVLGPRYDVNEANHRATLRILRSEGRG